MAQGLEQGGYAACKTAACASHDDDDNVMKSTASTATIVINITAVITITIVMKIKITTMLVSLVISLVVLLLRSLLLFVQPVLSMPRLLAVGLIRNPKPLTPKP